MPRPRGPKPRYRPEGQDGANPEENVAPKSPGTGPYQCEVPTCPQSFSRWSQLKRHERNHASDKPHRCDKCSSSFNLEYNLMLHKATHTTDKPECPDCHKMFSRIASLKAHIMLHEREENLICAECGDEFSLQSQLDKHLLEHQEEASGSAIYSCKLCNKEFLVQCLLKEHMKTHQKMRRPRVSSAQTQTRRVVDRSMFNQECEICTKTFKKPSQLVRHMRIHTGERPFQCDICNKAFNQKGSLQIHMTKHTGDKPHQCEFCPSVFSQKGNLRAHVARVHDVNKEVAMYPCESCSCSYRKLGSLNSHITRVHGGLGAVEKDGDEVGEVIEATATLQLDGSVLASSVVSDVIQQLLEISEHSEEHSYAHQQIQQIAMGAAGNINSDILQQALVNSGVNNDKQSEGSSEAGSTSRQVAAFAELLQRRKTLRLRRGRLHVCKYCSKTFKKPSDLARHIRIHTRERPFKCTQCFRSFTVKSTMTAHLKTHTGIKEYKCHVCNKMFSTHGSLKVHLRLHTGAKPFDCPHCEKKFRTTGHRKTHISSHFKEHALRRPRPNRMKQKASRPEIELPDVPLQEPILITDTGLIQQLPRNSAMYNNDYIGNGLQQGGSSIDRPYKCGYCAKSFKKSSHLKQHVRSHTGEKPFRCLQCGKSFVSTGVLKSHSRTHSGIKSYKCLICACTFTTNGSLKRHMSTHSEVRPFMCPYCQKTFKTSVNCKKHMKTHKRELGLQALDQVSTVGNEAEENENTAQTQEMQAQPTSQQSIVDQLVAVSAVQNQASLLGQLSNHAQEALRQQASLESADTNLSSQAMAQAQSNLDALTAQDTLTQATINSQTFMLTQQLANLANSHSGLTQEQQISLQTQQIQQQLEAITGITSVVVQTEQIPAQTVNQRMRLLRAEMEDGKRTYRCGYCNKAFKKSSHLKQHIRSHTGEKPYACIQCGRSFVSSGVLKSHQRTHTGVKAFACNICNTMFTTNGSLTRHMTIHSDVRPFDCPNCAESFRTAIHLKRHIRSVHEEIERNSAAESRRTRNVMVFTEEQTKELKKTVPPRNASVSEKVLIQEVLEKDRISEIQDKNELLEKAPKFANKCEHCPKSFKKPSDLVRHIRIHTGERPFKCDECGKTFTVKSTLECHMRTHRGGKSVTCHICRTVFATKGSLKVHMRLHTGAKPFKCPHCDERFRTSGSRKMHIIAHFKPVTVKKVSKAAQRSATTNAVQQFNIAETSSAQGAGSVPVDEAEQNLLQHQQQVLASQPHVLPITIAGNEGLTFGDGGMGATVLQGLDGLQLQLTATNLGQGLQLQGLDQSITVQIDPNLFQQLQHGSLNPIMLQTGELNLGQIGLHLPQSDQVLTTSAADPTLPQSAFAQAADPQQHLLVRIDPSMLQAPVDNPPVVSNTTDSTPVTLDTNLITPTQQQELPIIPVSFSGSSSQPSTPQILINPNMSSVDQALNLSTVTSMAGALPEDLEQPVQQLTQPLQTEKQPQIVMSDVAGALAQSVTPITSLVTTQPTIITSQTDPIISEMLQTVQDERSLTLGDSTLAADPSNVGQQTFQLSLGGETINLSQNIVLQPGIGAITGASNQTSLAQAVDSNTNMDQGTMEVLKVNIYQDTGQEASTREEALDDSPDTSQSKQGTMSVAEAAASIGSLYTCNAQDCTLVFTSMNQLRKHQSDAHGDLRPFVCSICNKAFKRHSHLKEHEATHLPKAPATRGSKATPFKCDTCGKGFSKQSQLQRHVRIHTGERPFTCPQCDKGFNQKNSLQMHMMRHTGEKPHQCEYCSMAFSQRGNLRVHMIRTHNAATFDPGQAMPTEMEDGEDMSQVMGTVPAGETSGPQESIDLESMVPHFFS